MSDFVNYNKRDVNLPPGCKDLIDVLRSHGVDPDLFQQQSDADQGRGVRIGGLTKGKSADIEKHVQSTVGSRFQFIYLEISAPDNRLKFAIMRLPNILFEAYIHVQAGTPEEVGLKRFFSQHHLESPDDSPMEVASFQMFLFRYFTASARCRLTVPDLLSLPLNAFGRSAGFPKKQS